MAPGRTMPKFTKPPEQLVTLFEAAIRAIPAPETRRMGGYPAAFSRGQMLASLFQDYLIIRLPEDEQTGFMRQYDASPFEPMPGRPMREYASVPEAVLESPALLDRWLREAEKYARSLPAKTRKATQGKPKVAAAKTAKATSGMRDRDRGVRR